MRRMSRAWRRALKWLSVALVALLLLAAAMWLRPAWTPAIHSAAGVASLEAVDLNGSRQWIAAGSLERLDQQDPGDHWG